MSSYKEKMIIAGVAAGVGAVFAMSGLVGTISRNGALAASIAGPFVQFTAVLLAQYIYESTTSSSS